jgi:hypothetical protein
MSTLASALAILSMRFATTSNSGEFPIMAGALHVGAPRLSLRPFARQAGDGSNSAVNVRPKPAAL